MLTNRTDIVSTRQVVKAATPWQPSAKNYGATSVAPRVLCLNSLPINFIGGGQLQGQAGRPESMLLSDRRHQYQV